MTAIGEPTPRPLARYQPLVPVLAAFFTGIVFDRGWGVGGVSCRLLAVLAWCVWWIVWRGGRTRAAAIPLLVSVAATSAVWHHGRWCLFERNQIGLFAVDTSEPAALEATIVRGPRRIPAPPFDPLRTIATPPRTRLELAATAIRDQDQWRAASGNLTLLVDGDLLGLQTGDRVRVFGQLSAMHAPDNPGEFDFSQFARGERRLCGLHSEFAQCVTRIGSGSRWNLSRLFDFLHARGDQLLFDSLGVRRAGLASAMFLGSREELEPEQT
jgi:competence protein ComEC